jgi:hypothetical protein
VVKWKTSPEPADGVKDAERRRATVIVTPHGAGTVREAAARRP